MTVAATIVCLLFLALLLEGERRQKRRLVYVAKPTASLCFIVVALAGSAVLDGTFHAWVVGGLVLGLVGDVFLMLPGKRSFLAGLVAFLLGHVAYVVACALLAGPAAWVSPWSLLPVALAAGVTRYLWPSLRRDHPRMRGPVMAYIFVITTMVVAALAVLLTAEAPDGAHRWSLFAGATLFFLSDVAVARSRFVAPGFMNRAWGLPAYYGGQLLVAWSALAW